MSDNEIRILKKFILEFDPFYTTDMLSQLTYDELWEIIKRIAKEEYK